MFVCRAPVCTSQPTGKEHLLPSPPPAWLGAELALDLVWELSAHASENSFNQHCRNPHFIQRKVLHGTAAVYRVTSHLGLPRTEVSWDMTKTRSKHMGMVVSSLPIGSSCWSRGEEIAKIPA